MATTTAPPVPTLRALLQRRELRLQLAVAEDALPAGALDQAVRWVHSSDLADPTPFLADELVLLTTGTQFVSDAGAGSADDDPTSYAAYIGRLQARGVRGLGFGTEVVRAGVPAGLVDACRDAGMPLFEVPYRTPFIAVARANAEAIAAQAYARRSWALAAQRALSLAALRADGVGALVAELARQLDGWAAVFDASGSLSRAAPAPLDDGAAADAVAAEVDAMLRRGARAGSSAGHDGRSFTLQTLGRTGHLRGVVALEAGELDAEARGVVTAAVATIGLAWEQQEGVDRTRRALHRGLARALVQGETPLVSRVLRETGAALPAEPVVVGYTGMPEPATPAVDWLQVRAAGRRGRLFSGGVDDGVLIVASDDDGDLIAEFAERFAVAAGISDPARYTGVEEAVRQARVAREQSTPGVATSFRAVAGGRLAAALAGEEARTLAAAMLAPLREHDHASGTALATTVRVWLSHDCSHEAAARALGVHRHTVRTRLALAERLLGLDLSAFPVRAELWTAMQLMPAAD
jgi:purine catabolism regulator